MKMIMKGMIATERSTINILLNSRMYVGDDDCNEDDNDDADCNDDDEEESWCYWGLPCFPQSPVNDTNYSPPQYTTTPQNNTNCSLNAVQPMHIRDQKLANFCCTNMIKHCKWSVKVNNRRHGPHPYTIWFPPTTLHC